MTMIVFFPDGQRALVAKIDAHAEVISVLRLAYYNLGLVSPDYEVNQN